MFVNNLCGMLTFIGVFVAATVATVTSHNWFGVPAMEAGALGLIMWPVVAERWWMFGAVAYVLTCVTVGS